MVEESEFLKSLRVGKELDGGEAVDEGQGDTQSAHAKPKPMRSLRDKRMRGPGNVPFNHSVTRTAVETFYDIAIKHDWTMNKTLTIASELLAKADAEGKL
jgi:hypothetical protein